MKIIVAEYKPGDIHDIKMSHKQPELVQFPPHKLDKQFLFPSLSSFTLRDRETKEILLIVGVAYSNYMKKNNKKEAELITVFSQTLTENFIKYFKSLYSLFKHLFTDLGLDFLVCLCYNSNIRGLELLKKLKFKEKDIDSPLENFKVLVCER